MHHIHFSGMPIVGAKNTPTPQLVKAFGKEHPGFPQPKRSIANYTNFFCDILVDDKDGVRILTIRRPQAANALGLGICDEVL